MAHVVPYEVWRDQVLSNLDVCDFSRVRSSSRASGTSVIGCDFIFRRIDALLRRYGLSGLIDVDRHGGTAGAAPLPGGLSRIDYLCRVLYLLERGGRLWAWLGGFLRVAAIYRLTPAMPLVISAEWVQQHWPTRAAVHQLPLALAIYKTIGHLLSYEGDSLALTTDEQTNENEAGEDDGDDENHIYPHKVGKVRFRVMAAEHTDDPAVEEDDVHSADRYRYERFSAFMMDNLLVYWWPRPPCGPRQPSTLVLEAPARSGDARYGAFMATDAFGDCVVVDMRQRGWGVGVVVRQVLLCGHRADEAIVAHLTVRRGGKISLFTTERRVHGVGGDLSAGDECYPITVRHARDVLRRVRLEREVIDQGTRVDDDGE
ncbi:unnamed protein product [Vitrella brassicaformis CCMP3155]|uniref:Uncharacterized protein n=1 Tax=Vitrella brassicaformis (strain CCMP3155) TaxID=1169540 RepID=A0A0G4EVR0_VITBC|nr:unnamed protein product [Vitrella brassicaformis CCMP3155]|eukprot:CEM02737.1 unnamed protein product [Vitrella brassicaformis CCMP3155]